MQPSNFVENSVLRWFSPDYLFNQAVLFFRQLSEFFQNIDLDVLSLFNNILFFLTLFFITIISYTSIRLLEIRSKEHKHLEHELAEYAHRQAEKAKKEKKGEEVSNNPRWIKTLDYLFSQHASDWRLAVIEADSMLEDLMGQLGFRGDDLGDKLKNATAEKFKSLASAWEVHTIRNRIAHEGASFLLSQHEAKRVIALYEQIFRLYGYI